MPANNFVHRNYSWIVLIMGTLVVFGALGLARYGYSMVLPEMQISLEMDNTQAGALATSNLAGYLAFALIGGAMAARIGIRLVVTMGLIMAGGGMLLTGLADDFLPVAVWRGITGLGSGAANVAVMGLWAAWFSRRWRGLASGIAVAGSSMGLIFTGLMVPWLIAEYGDPAWRISWYIFSGIALFMAVAAYLVLRNNPGEMGMQPVLEEKTNNNNQEEEDASASSSNEKPPSWKEVYLSAPVWVLGLVYSAFGFSYIIYMTFFVNFLVQEYTYTAAEAGNLYMIMGWVSLLCGIIWGSLSDIIGRKNTLVIIFLIHCVSFSLFGLGDASIYFTISAVLYGLTAWSIPAVMAAACGDMLGAKFAPAALGFITLFFGIGQALGPMAGGSIADFTGSFAPAFLLAAAVALLGAIGSATLLKEKK